ncbi:MAG: TetR/AcrR family transcriptional regulator [Rhodospirillaceae bacterium]|nr:TetR/AcrR family transcriptional regulator [Rhodospirillaceae bacterium]
MPQTAAQSRPEAATRKGELQRERILEAAAGQFLADGYAAASVRSIADAAGIGPSTLYHYFASKEDILVAVHEEGLKRIQAALVAALEGVEAPSASPWGRLETACVAHLEALLEGGLIFRAVMREMPSVFDRDALERIRVTRDNYERIFARLLDDLSLPRGTDRHELRLMLLGSLNWAFTWYRPGRSTPAQLAQTFVGFLKTQLQVDPPA